MNRLLALASLALTRTSYAQPVAYHTGRPFGVVDAKDLQRLEAFARKEGVVLSPTCSAPTPLALTRPAAPGVAPSSVDVRRNIKRATLILLASASVLFAKGHALELGDAPVVMPEFRVYGPKLKRYTFTPSQDRDGSFIFRLKPDPAPDVLTIVVGCGQPGDVVIGMKTANGIIEVRSMSRRTWVSDLPHGDVKLVIRRAAGNRSYRLVELDARRM